MAVIIMREIRIKCRLIFKIELSMSTCLPIRSIKLSYLNVYFEKESQLHVCNKSRYVCSCCGFAKCVTIVKMRRGGGLQVTTVRSGFYRVTSCVLLVTFLSAIISEAFFAGLCGFQCHKVPSIG